MIATPNAAFRRVDIRVFAVPEEAHALAHLTGFVVRPPGANKMMTSAGYSTRGFTLIELLIALLILSVLALMSYRGLGAVLDAREHVTREADQWRRVAAFVDRFERDVKLAAPRPVRSASGTAPAWRGNPDCNVGTAA